MLFGKATAYAIINGHPGPRCLISVVGKYICTSKEPELGELDVKDVKRADVTAAIEEVSSVNFHIKLLCALHF